MRRLIVLFALLAVAAAGGSWSNPAAKADTCLPRTSNTPITHNCSPPPGPAGVNQCPPGDQCVQTCYFTGSYAAPGSWFQVCGGNYWTQIHVDFTYAHSWASGCEVAAGFGSTQNKAWRCNSGHADAYSPRAYGNIWLYNTSPYGVYYTGTATA